MKFGKHEIKSIIFYNRKLFSNIVFIGLGSNLGNKFENIHRACSKINQFTKLKKTSQLYYSPCINLDNQIEKNENYFVNLVIKIETDLKYDHNDR